MSSLYVLSALNVLLLLLAITGLTFYLQWKAKRRHLLQLAAKIPAPGNISCYPIIGHAHHFIGDTEKHLQILSAFSSTSLHPSTIYVGPMVYHVIMRPEDIETVLNSSKAFSKDRLYSFFKTGRGYGLLNLDVRTWRVHRKIIGPTLNQRILNRQLQILDKKSQIMTTLMGKEPRNGFDLFPFIMNCALDCLFETSMGADFHCQTDDVYGMNKMFARDMEIAMLRLLNLPLHPDFIYKLTSMAKEERQIIESFCSIVDKQKVYEEIIEVMGTERDVEASDLPNLKYTEMTIKESMRLFPAVPVFLRKLDEDLELETCTLPKEAGLILSTLTLHRHPQCFKDPLKFIPERFTPEEAAKRHPYSFLPFSAGPRNCIGLKYGMMLVKCVLASILRKYVVSTEYKSVEEIRLKQCMVLKPVLGFKLHITPRQG